MFFFSLVLVFLCMVFPLVFPWFSPGFPMVFDVFPLVFAALHFQVRLQRPPGPASAAAPAAAGALGWLRVGGEPRDAGGASSVTKGHEEEFPGNWGEMMDFIYIYIYRFMFHLMEKDSKI